MGVDELANLVRKPAVFLKAFVAQEDTFSRDTRVLMFTSVAEKTSRTRRICIHNSSDPQPLYEGKNKRVVYRNSVCETVLLSFPPPDSGSRSGSEVDGQAADAETLASARAIQVSTTVIAAREQNAYRFGLVAADGLRSTVGAGADSDQDVDGVAVETDGDVRALNDEAEETKSLRCVVRGSLSIEANVSQQKRKTNRERLH